ncbi:MAG TPA: dCMP deaminase family protein [Candidatus Dormibacteraeota bacterium]|nr:dCMP deaminase family protein [Candidatus Dormibacteraeota bacterium]
MSDGEPTTSLTGTVVQPPGPPQGITARPDKRLYFMVIALAARTRADCLGRRVGAVIAREDRVLSTGYNGTPFGMPNCSEGGCHRCARRDTETFRRGGAYDVCLCVHAEQNAILTAARFGQQTLGSSLTSTMQPCFGCLKEMLQAGISEVRYLHPWDPLEAYGDEALVQQYAALRSRFNVFEQVGDPATDTDELFAPVLGRRRP